MSPAWSNSMKRELVVPWSIAPMYLLIDLLSRNYENASYRLHFYFGAAGQATRFN